MSMSECSSALCQKTVQHVMEFNGRKGDWLCLWQVLHPPDDWNRGGDFRIWLFLWREKSWLSSKSRDFSMPLFFAYRQQLHMKGDLPSEIFLRYAPGVVIWIRMSSRPSSTEKMRICSTIWVFGLLFFFLEWGVCVCPLQ